MSTVLSGPGFERPQKRQRLRFGNEHMVVEPLVDTAFDPVVLKELDPDDKSDFPEIADMIKTKQTTERSNAHKALKGCETEAGHS